LATTRVHLLAKELDVKSKAIIDKCQAEGLDIKNHMSTISAGLAATIREWFSEGFHTTAVETTARVDLKKVRAKKKKEITKKPDKEQPGKQTAAVEQAEQTVTATAPPSQTPTETPDTKQQPVPYVQAEPEPAKAEIITEPPKPTKPIMPAGPKLEKPKPAKAKIKPTAESTKKP
jgi:translation initiation factor IF-2